MADKFAQLEYIIFKLLFQPDCEKGHYGQLVLLSVPNTQSFQHIFLCSNSPSKAVVCV